MLFCPASPQVKDLQGFANGGAKLSAFMVLHYICSYTAGAHVSKDIKWSLQKVLHDKGGP